MIELPSLYQQYIHMSRYSRFRYDLGRRETWQETVDRYFDFFEEHLRTNFGYEIPAFTLEYAKEMVLTLQVLPSMRALMTAGDALRRDHLAGYNCAYIPILDAFSFAEILYILMCGTGVGFSVERQYISNLPEVPTKLSKSHIHQIVVGDSKRGWAQSFKELLDYLYSGTVPLVDTSLVRPAGSPLITFGGRASGPEPLIDLFEFTIDIFKAARGRKLNSLECHDISTMIGNTVVVGGVRRSAMISLSNLSDDRMRSAKSGQWWDQNPQRALANNSVAYTEKPEVGHFMKEWLALYESKSGERGIFNREGIKRKIAQIGRRSSGVDYGTNPCAEIILRPYQLCNLSEIVVTPKDDLSSLSQKAKVAAILGTWQASLTKFQFVRKDWSENCENDALLGVSMTGIMSNLENLDNKSLVFLKNTVLRENKIEASAIGINRAAGATTVKPSGTASQLAGTSSGIHPDHAEYYIRRVRGDTKDPLVRFMQDKGFPNEPDFLKPNAMVVFSFPMKSPQNAVRRENLSAIDHLEIVKDFYQNWSEHAVSCTISVKEEEWPVVGGWVWQNFDNIGGVSFLPYSDHTYRQAPFEEITEKEYKELLEKMPTEIDWSELQNYENGLDNTIGTQTLACTAGVCEIADITPAE